LPRSDALAFADQNLRDAVTAVERELDLADVDVAV
jgi:hypothetical protein